MKCPSYAKEDLFASTRHRNCCLVFDPEYKGDHGVQSEILDRQTSTAIAHALLVRCGHADIRIFHNVLPGVIHGDSDPALVN